MASPQPEASQASPAEGELSPSDEKEVKRMLLSWTEQNKSLEQLQTTLQRFKDKKTPDPQNKVIPFLHVWDKALKLYQKQRNDAWNAQVVNPVSLCIVAMACSCIYIP